MMATAVQMEQYLGTNFSSNSSERQKVSFNLSTSHQLVYNSRKKGTVATYQYTNSADYSTYFLGIWKPEHCSASISC
jgi:hypothetical protein